MKEECFQWIWEKITRCLNPRWQCLNTTWQNSRWLPSSSWVRMNEWSSFCAKVWIQDSRIQDGCHHQVESEWMSEVFFVQNGWIKDGRFQDSYNHQVESEWMSEVFLWKCWELILASVSEFERKNQDGWIQDGRIQDGYHHLVNQMELVWLRVRVKEEWFQWIWEKITRCLNPRWQCLNSTWQNSRWLPSSSWVRMNEWSSFCAKWLNPRWQNSRWLPSSSWVRMNEWSFFCTEWLNQGWQISR